MNKSLRLMVLPVYLMLLSLIMLVMGACSCTFEVQNHLSSSDGAVNTVPNDQSPELAVTDVVIDDAATPNLPDADLTRPTIRSDAGRAEDARRTDATPPSDAEVTDADPMPTQAMIVESLRCRDGTMHLPASLFGPDTTVWHLCYTTPMTMRGSDGPGRPLAVVFTRRDTLGAEPVEVMRVEAPRVANPWTASIAVAVHSPGERPLFNAYLDYGLPTRPLAAHLDASGTESIQDGSFRLWRVSEIGEKTRMMPRILADRCLIPGMPSPDAHVDWFPDMTPCPSAELMRCPPGPLHCLP